MESLLNNNVFLIYIITMLYVAIIGVKMTERKRISLIYIFSFILTIVGSVPAIYTVIGSIIILFVYLEIMCDDNMKIKLFYSVKYKTTDFTYRIFVEYFYHYFIISIILLGVPAIFGYTAINYIISVIFILIAIFSLTSQKYLTKSITNIINNIEDKTLIREMVISEKVKEMLYILTSMEDVTFFMRGNRQHAISVESVIDKGIVYIKAHGLGHIPQTISNLFNRGYGTIEMQLIRSVGVELGYDTHKYRRKIFEILFSNMILNSYYDYLVGQGIDCSQYREFIILKYIENVPIKINDKRIYPGNTSSLLRLFNKNDVSEITKEEFFVWCLGLPQWQRIGPVVLGFYSTMIKRFGINLDIVNEKLLNLK